MAPVVWPYGGGGRVDQGRSNKVVCEFVLMWGVRPVAIPVAHFEAWGKG